jgi:hypothetical protein
MIIKSIASKIGEKEYQTYYQNNLLERRSLLNKIITGKLDETFEIMQLKKIFDVEFLL